MEEWKKYKMSDFIDFNPTVSLKKGTVARKITMDKLIPHSRDIYDWEYEPYSGGTKFQNGDTIMARITPCLENGKHAFISLLNDGETAYGSTEFIVMRGIPGISDNRFVYYLSHFPDFKNAAVKSMVGSSGRQRAQVDVIKNLEFYLPGLVEQRKIADTLSALDDKIALNNRINHNLEEQAQALYKSWFVDFEPFRKGRFIESELGLIPEGWQVKNLLEISRIFDSKRRPLSGKEREQMSKIYPYYGATSIMDYVDSYIFDGIYLLMGEDGSVMTEEGYPFLQYITGKFWPNNHAHVLQGDNGFSTEMLHCALLRKVIKSSVTGAVQAKISQANMKKILFPCPPSLELKAFDSQLQTIYCQKRNIEAQNSDLAMLRDSLLPVLVVGKLNC